MNKSLYDFSWQAVGISSDPSIKKDSISLHMQNYLKWGSKYSRRHLVIVDDILQAFNYRALYDFDNQSALATASAKGMRKLQDLAVIAHANNFTNIDFLPLSTIRKKCDSLEQSIKDLCLIEPEVHDKLEHIIPDRFSEGCSLDQSNLLTNYVIGEIATTLYLGGTRISNTKEIQKKVNEASFFLHTIYNIGNPICFVYPKELGQECELGKKGKVEPYSASFEEHRILLTDTRSTLLYKCLEADHQERREFSRWLNRTSGIGLHPLRLLYDKQIRPARRALRKEAAKRNAFIIGSMIAGSALFSVILGLQIATALHIQNNNEASRAFIKAVADYRK